MKLVFLWTDLLIWVLVLASFTFAIHSLRYQHLREPWRHIGRSKIAMSSLLILVVYVLVALSDSIHFNLKLKNSTQYSTQVTSILDLALEPIKSSSEKTYSAPLAINLLNKEPTEQGGRSVLWQRPRLVHGGQHLMSAQEHRQDVVSKTLEAVLYSVCAWLVFIFLYISLEARIKRVSLVRNAKLWGVSENAHARPAILLTTLFIFLVVGFITFMTQYYHIFGTDKAGQDVLYQSIKSIRTGLLIGTLTTLIMLPFAVILGITAGYMRGWMDDLIQYLYTTISSIPGVLLIAASILMVQVYISNNPESFDSLTEQADLRMLSLCIILGVTTWTGLCRIIRSEVLKIRESEYVLAAKSLGVGNFKIMIRHLLPNVMHIILISVILDFSSLVLAESILSYIGIGVDPSTFSWGNMINSARLEMAREPVIWWTLVAAFSFMFLLVLAANLFSDVVRAAYDPRTLK